MHSALFIMVTPLAVFCIIMAMGYYVYTTPSSTHSATVMHLLVHMLPYIYVYMCKCVCIGKALLQVPYRKYSMRVVLRQLSSAIYVYSPYSTSISNALPIIENFLQFHDLH